MAEDKRNPKDTSNIFHSIMKASVKPLKKDKVVKQKNKNHYVIYWQDGKYVTTTPRDWAREFGSKHNLDADTRTQGIEDCLKSKFKFIEFTFDNSVVLCHLDTFTPNF